MLVRINVMVSWLYYFFLGNYVYMLARLWSVWSDCQGKKEIYSRMLMEESIEKSLNSLHLHLC